MKPEDLDKLIVNDGTDKAPDAIEGNKAKAEKILELMFKKYPLDDLEINNEITQFKANQDLTTTEALWGAGIDNIVKVIDELSTMTDVNDRLSVHWDFKKVIGTLIHITKNNGDASKLIYTLSEIKMCDLSKLINLLAVVQDEIINSSAMDYSKKSLQDYENILKLTLDSALSALGDKIPLALIKWKNDLTNKRDIKDSEQWCGYTQKLHGIFNKIFAENAEQVNIDSYHFTDGLKLIIINQLIGKLQSVKLDEKNDIITIWKNNIEQGKAILAAEFFDKIISGEKTIDSLDDAVFDYPLSFGELQSLSASTIKGYYKSICDKYGEKMAKQFAQKLANCSLNDEAAEYLNECLAPITTTTTTTINIINTDSINNIYENSNHDDSITLQGDTTDC